MKPWKTCISSHRYGERRWRLSCVISVLLLFSLAWAGGTKDGPSSRSSPCKAFCLISIQPRPLQENPDVAPCTCSYWSSVYSLRAPHLILGTQGRTQAGPLRTTPSTYIPTLLVALNVVPFLAFAQWKICICSYYYFWNSKDRNFKKKKSSFPSISWPFFILICVTILMNLWIQIVIALGSATPVTNANQAERWCLWKHTQPKASYPLTVKNKWINQCVQRRSIVSVP